MTSGPTRRMTLADAARELGITKEAVRKRVQRETLASDKGEDGRVYVYLPHGEDTGAPGQGTTTSDPERDELIAELREEVAAWREEARRKDHIIAGLVERLPSQLEPSSEERESPVTPTEEVGSTSTPTEDTGQPRRSWWRWFLGME